MNKDRKMIVRIKIENKQYLILFIFFLSKKYMQVVLRIRIEKNSIMKPFNFV
jgi:hypothetical protein